MFNALEEIFFYIVALSICSENTKGMVNLKHMRISELYGTSFYDFKSFLFLSM